MEVRIICKPLLDGRVEIFHYDPITCRTTQPGMKVSRNRVDAEVRSIKRALEKNRFQVTVKEM